MLKLMENIIQTTMVHYFIYYMIILTIVVMSQDYYNTLIQIILI